MLVLDASEGLAKGVLYFYALSLIEAGCSFSSRAMLVASRGCRWKFLTAPLKCQDEELEFFVSRQNYCDLALMSKSILAKIWYTFSCFPSEQNFC